MIKTSNKWQLIGKAITQTNSHSIQAKSEGAAIAFIQPIIDFILIIISFFELVN